MPAYRVQTVFKFGVCVSRVCVCLCALRRRVCARGSRGFVWCLRLKSSYRVVIGYDFASASHWLSESVVTLTRVLQSNAARRIATVLFVFLSCLITVL